MPKVHKPDCPLRVIVSLKNSPLYCLAKFLQDTIYDAIPRTDSHVADSFHLVEKLKNVYIDEHLKLISLDVVSLFTNIPLDLAMDSVVKRWTHIEKKCDIPRNDFFGGNPFYTQFHLFFFQ